MDFDQPPVVEVRGRPGAAAVPRRVAGDDPRGRAAPAGGTDPAPGVTFLVGENGPGKSTIVEAVAMAYGLGPRGWLHRQPARHPRARSRRCRPALRLQRGLGAGRWGFFLRAETMHGFYTYLEQNPGHAGRTASRSSTR